MTSLKDYIKWVLRGEIPVKILTKRGMKVGRNFQKQDLAIIDYWHCHLISIGDNVTIAPRSYILAHDASTKNAIGYSKIGKVIIGNNVFIGAGAIILPNVQIGDNVVIGAGSVISKSVASNSVVIGNPQIIVKKFDDYILNNKQNLLKSVTFGEEYTGRLTEKQRNDMDSKLEGFGYLK